MKILRRLDQTRIDARKIDCDQRMKTALKSKINNACGKSYSFGEPVWFKLESSHRWKSGIAVGQDGKVVFIKYANFIRRVPLDLIIPADEYNDEANGEIDKEDLDHSVRLNDDKFEDMEILVKKDKEIEQLNKSMHEQANVIKEMENNFAKERKSIKQSKNNKLPNLYQTVDFKESKNRKSS